jgi:D-lyxose ketol-isomerase
MITRSELKDAQKRTAEMLKKAGIVITDEEVQRIAAADFGLSRLEKEGAQILTFLETDRVAFKAIVLFPNQTMPEHWHPPVGDDPGKEETIRVISGPLFFYIPGDENIREGFIPEGKEAYYTVRHEIAMNPGDQITVEPGKVHWFQSGIEGSVMYSISSTARDILDRFTDPEIVRETVIID